MTRLEAVLRALAADLDELRAKWALVGGLAVAVRAEPRLTRDIDVAVVAGDESAIDALVLALQQRRYALKTILQQRHTQRFATLRMLPPPETARGTFVDLLLGSCGIEREIVEAAQTIAVFPAVSVPVARTGHLIAMKLLAFDERKRPQDHDDLLALLRSADESERKRTDAALRLIETRGTTRGKDLRAELARFERLAAES